MGTEAATSRNLRQKIHHSYIERFPFLNGDRARRVLFTGSTRTGKDFSQLGFIGRVSVCGCAFCMMKALGVVVLGTCVLMCWVFWDISGD